MEFKVGHSNSLWICLFVFLFSSSLSLWACTDSSLWNPRTRTVFTCAFFFLLFPAAGPCVWTAEHYRRLPSFLWYCKLEKVFQVMWPTGLLWTCGPVTQGIKRSRMCTYRRIISYLLVWCGVVQQKSELLLYPWSWLFSWTCMPWTAFYSSSATANWF